MQWVLIVAILSPGGDFISKTATIMPTQQQCEQAKTQVDIQQNPMHLVHRGVCVTHAHYVGKSKMPNVAYD